MKKAAGRDSGVHGAPDDAGVALLRVADRAGFMDFFPGEAASAADGMSF